MRPGVQACVLLARCLTNQWIELHQTLVDDVVEGTDKLITGCTLVMESHGIYEDHFPGLESQGK